MVNGVKLWDPGCVILNDEVKVSIASLTSCDVDNTPFADCLLRRVSLDSIQNNRVAFRQRGMKRVDGDAFTALGRQLTARLPPRAFLGRGDRPLWVRNIMSLERQRLPTNRDRLNPSSWPQLTKKLGVTLSAGSSLPPCGYVFETPVVFLYAYHCSSVWHTHEGLYRLWQTMRSHDLLGRKDVTVVRIDKHRDGQPATWPHRNYWDVFDVKLMNVSSLEPSTCFDELYVVGYPQHLFDKRDTSAADVQEYRSFMLRGLGIREETECNSAVPSVILISRCGRLALLEHSAMKNFGRRHMLNEERVISLLRATTKADVEAVSFELLSRKEQALKVCKASVLIGVHSGALLHTLWLKPKKILIQVQSAGEEYGTRQIWTRPHVLVTQGIGHFDMEQLAYNVGAKYFNQFVNGATGPSAVVESCTRPLLGPIKLAACFQVFKKERAIFARGDDFRVNETEIVLKVKKALLSCGP
eukprot:CAMPEP_0197581944 /NCGR_PEP_ID=MMETSP1326-20131121/5307_1 /TAXON_ID=1155430 /ORGANISM="Genus nov. species nov., Strain RCC2288" /LENGTH=469 /DNA_ID=CAMNT_0043145933 /DNA_START=452 /DNA_END=1861 /DNA_ORIENTATION=+